MFKRLALWILFVVLLILSWRPVFDLWSNELDRTINADLDSNIRAVMKFAGPHLQDCKHCSAMNSKFDHDSTSTREFPAWINGAEEDNLPFTRRVQRDIWLHQHPRNCSDAKFLAHWHETSSSVGVGSDMVSMAGMLGAAIIENRFLITHGAKHKGCAGSSHGRWSCYFVPEASEECITRALQLSMQEEARREGIVKDFSGDQWNLVPSLEKQSCRPWMPRPMVSIHVRQEDKGREMEIIPFHEYMKLANSLCRRFPDVKSVWLSTEMEDVMEESEQYKDWNFYYTSFVNLLIAGECDLFVGVLGSTWSYVLDGLRMTNGKVTSGVLTVNPINSLLI
ncbi:hypothetical protein SELMODRAFT_448238 [Selaginella moellendorffii]|uniref:O-fucosyltransferase family protein n=1 Tax=Selaginella moellendorffii TaxID=88036 RepID=D8T5T2_SELML|nr:hypothetical protein SELMODRAFT_448238 [Selaginella moellendorffii]